MAKQEVQDDGSIIGAARPNPKVLDAETEAYAAEVQAALAVWQPDGGDEPEADEVARVKRVIAGEEPAEQPQSERPSYWVPEEPTGPVEAVTRQLEPTEGVPGIDTSARLSRSQVIDLLNQ